MVTIIIFIKITIEAGNWPPANPNWFKQQEMMAKLGPMLGGFGFGGGAQAA